MRRAELHPRSPALLRLLALSALVGGALGSACGGGRNEATSAPVTDAPLRYSLDAAEGRQTLAATPVGDDRLDVVLERTGPCSRREAGTAALQHPEADPEIEVDADGEGHAVDAYELEPREACTISIRLAIGDRSLAWVREDGCDPSCPLSPAPMPRH